MRTLRIALYPGDGIGREVLAETVRVLDRALALEPGCGVEFTSLPWGSDYHAQHGRVAPEDFLDTLQRFDAILLGALGNPARLPDHVTLEPLIQLRQGFDQYACVRPCRLWPGVRGLLSSEAPIDLLVLRENSEGEYAVCGGRVRRGQREEVATQTAIHTRRGIERILRFGFQAARERRRRLTMVTKSNALRHGMVLWDETLEALRPEFPDVDVTRQHADAVAMDFVRRPERFDVVVASNLFGDILSDLAAVITGGLGLAPSANLNPERRFPSMFEPVHGSAPDIAGRGIANPVAAILSAAMMIEWLGLCQAARAIRSAVGAALAAGAHTQDLGGALTTTQMTDAILGGP